MRVSRWAVSLQAIALEALEQLGMVGRVVALE
jgi:hypothetical protein